MNSVTIKEARETVHELLVSLAGRDDKTIYWSPHEILARLTEEVGELAKEVNAEYGPKKKRDKDKKDSLAEELADVLQTTLMMANALDVDIEAEFTKKVEHLKQRDQHRFR
jgi:NTP pyrophosphatase (non-canonical NTP hydrolase)